jgi:ubiquinone/menaquinone biosynthesis C-methylase UbiE
MTKKITSKDVYTQEVGDLYDEAAISCQPLHRDMLLDLAAEHGVGKDSLVLDIGCANGGVSRKLQERTGCRIEGVELLKFLVDMGIKQNAELGIADRFRIQQGSITDIPFDDNTFDFVFCDDVIGIVEDLPKAMSECRRVLKPQGKMLIYASFATDRLSEREAHELNTSLGGASKGLDIAYAEGCIQNSFKLVKKTVIGSQFTQLNTEQSKDESEATKGLLKVARLLTWPDKYIEKYGQQVYQIVLAEAHWSVYILLGKLQPTVFIVQKDGV